MKKWDILHKEEIIDIADIIPILLKNRGISSDSEIKDFLNPSITYINPENAGLNTKEIDKATRRISQAIENKESIAVYTDYDADGVSAGAIIWETLYGICARVMPYVPHREDEGYGLSKKGIDILHKENNTTLIITVDHGVTALKEIDYAKDKGIDTVILDHHILPEILPKSVALIHTTKMSSGGIAWIFANILFRKLSKIKINKKDSDDFQARYMDLAALATIADLTPLTGVNRVLVKFGLEQINKTERVGLKALIKESGLERDIIGTYEVGHILSPRINAMGRLTHALDALRLLCTNDPARAEKLAKLLDETNRERQLLTESSSKYALEMIKHHMVYGERDKKPTKLIIISSREFKEGVIGLIAGKLVDQFYRPAIVLAEGKDYCKASARSISGFNIVEAIRSVSDLLVDVGGHPMAAGFTIATKNLEYFRKKMQKIAQDSLDEDKLIKTLKADAALRLSDITYKLYNQLKELAPYGIGNPEPVFVSFNIEVLAVSQVGKEKKHLKLIVRQTTNLPQNQKLGNNNVINAIGFNMGHFFGKISPHGKIDIAYSINSDDWNGNNRLQLKLKDVKFLP